MKNHKIILIAFILSLIFIIVNSSVVFAGSYTMDIIDLGTLQGDSVSYATAINNSTTVSGNSINSQGESTAFFWSRWSNGGELNPLVSGKKETYATSINNSGRIVGGDVNNGTTKIGTWTTYGSNKMKTIKGNSLAYNINDNGQIVGTKGRNETPYIWSIWGGHNPVKVGGNLSWNYETARDVNNNGLVIGETTLGTPYIWNMYNKSSDFFSSSQGTANDINDSGAVVGSLTDSATGNSQAYVYENGNLTELGYLGAGTDSSAYAINEEGVIVGSSNNSAFIWSANNNLLNLNDLLPDGSDWTNLSVASDINDLGQIVGWGTINGETHAFLISEIVAAPEPKLIFVIFASIGVILYRILLGKNSNF